MWIDNNMKSLKEWNPQIGDQLRFAPTHSPDDGKWHNFVVGANNTLCQTGNGLIHDFDKYDDLPYFQMVKRHADSKPIIKENVRMSVFEAFYEGLEDFDVLITTVDGFADWSKGALIVEKES
jgi:hypothetical protein